MLTRFVKKILQIIFKSLPHTPKGPGYVSIFSRIEGYGEKIYLERNSTIARSAWLICQRPDAYIHIGENSLIDSYTILDVQKKGYIKIGKNSSLHAFSVILAGGGVEIGENVRAAPNLLVLTGKHNFDDVEKNIYGQGSSFKKIVIEDDVWMGAGVTIIGGVTVGTHSVLAAGSVVTKDVPPNSIVAGNPARIIRKRGES
jgi:acetyltransferase-like isoleucine patch superfamily enzyme